MIANKETLEDVIFSDECTVQLDRHSKLCLQKIEQPRKAEAKTKTKASLQSSRISVVSE